MNATNVAFKYNQFMFNNYITWFLAFLGIFMWATDHELYLSKRETSKDYRIKLLYLNLFISALLGVSITISHIIWIKYNNLIKPELDVGITERYRSWQQDNLKLKFFDSRIYTYLFEIAINMISPMPWLYDQHYPDKYFEDGVQIYANSELLTFMILFRTYHIIKVWLQTTEFMDARAERITRIFSPDCK